MSGIGAIQPVSAAETWEAWQALMHATLGDAVTQPHLAGDMHADLQVQPAAEATLEATAHPDVAPAPVSAPHETPRAATALPVQLAAAGLPGDQPVAATRTVDANAAVLPMAPVLLTPLALQGGPELRWRVQDASAWRALFDDAGRDAPHDEADLHEPLPLADSDADSEAEAEAMPAWAQVLLARLRGAAADPASADALRPALQAWRLGLPVLLASPVGLACLLPSRDAGTWQCRRWPARWRAARPAIGERWWAVRVGLSAQGRARTLRELVGARALAPGQVSCELRLDDVAPGIAQWAEVLVQAPASPSLRALLGARSSLTWLLCNQPLWPQESA
ncbi:MULTISPECIES: hypothetical protein [unclassified Roseateles]|uniref:hypothetical protein n=1 Tax=unclassified Roseateles TaxID=2626991 RepID=UPI0006FAE90B|nr:MULTISPECIES: hypothetical protein [unclassified Roseateles]KQW49645.1 hypothetical protein ASC81_25470 [Pelomonas sp. Root405]KRA76104.1 hypothetical protein ASD88_25420 [Pelomonas sp. Root662]